MLVRFQKKYITEDLKILFFKHLKRFKFLKFERKTKTDEGALFENFQFYIFGRN